MNPKTIPLALLLAVVLCKSSHLGAQVSDKTPVDKWVTVTAEAAGETPSAKEQAVSAALRKAVEESCGTFIRARTETENYTVVYDRIFADAVGYVVEHKVLKNYSMAGMSYAVVRARVSTKKFQKDWSLIAHTVARMGNPRVMLAIGEVTEGADTVWPEEGAGTFQSNLEDFLLSKDIKLIDRKTIEDVAKRDFWLAVQKQDPQKIAATGARFHADVIVTGLAKAEFDRGVTVAGVRVYKYTARFQVKAIRVDTAELLVSKSYGPVTVTTMKRAGGEDVALKKLGQQMNPKFLTALINAWRKQLYVRRAVTLVISDMSYSQWKVFRDELKQARGLQDLNLREIIENVATIDANYSYKTQQLADAITELKKIKLEVTEITANRIKLKAVTAGEEDKSTE
ncbi:MAG: hypothetical protein ACLFVU_09435 [Phycisphaerae bacterium]